MKKFIAIALFGKDNKEEIEINANTNAQAYRKASSHFDQKLWSKYTLSVTEIK